MKKKLSRTKKVHVLGWKIIIKRAKLCVGRWWVTCMQAQEILV
jgi:hypothetical protein